MAGNIKALSFCSLVTLPGLGLLHAWGYELPSLGDTALLSLAGACAVGCLFIATRLRQLEKFVVICATVIFLLSYILQAVIFRTSQEAGSSLGEALSVRSIFSTYALGATESEVGQALVVVLVGYLGIFVAAIYLAAGAGHKGALIPDESWSTHVSRVANTAWLGYTALFIAVVFGFLRKYFGLDSPAPSGLLPGVGGFINICSLYVGPNLFYAALFYAFESDTQRRAARMAVLCLLLGVFNYVLFTSKMSLIFPVIYILLCQHLIGRTVVSRRLMLILAIGVVALYPFLNFYRAAVALNLSASNILPHIAALYSAAQTDGESEKGVLQVALGAILGRFVGYDPLLILLQIQSYPGSIVDYLMDGNLDRYLTYQILDFEGSMGYSPGFLGRLYYISDSYVTLMVATSLTVVVLAWSIRHFWRANSWNKYLTPLLLTYCLIFFTDGLRFELVRSLIVSSFIVFLILAAMGQRSRGNR